MLFVCVVLKNMTKSIIQLSNVCWIYFMNRKNEQWGSNILLIRVLIVCIFVFHPLTHPIWWKNKFNRWSHSKLISVMKILCFAQRPKNLFWSGCMSSFSATFFQFLFSSSFGYSFMYITVFFIVGQNLSHF